MGSHDPSRVWVPRQGTHNLYHDMGIPHDIPRSLMGIPPHGPAMKGLRWETCVHDIHNEGKLWKTKKNLSYANLWYARNRKTYDCKNNVSSVPRKDGLVRSDCLALETWTSSAEWELAWSCKDGIDISGTALTVDMYIYICIYVCIYIYIYMCVYMYIHIYMCVYVYTYIYMYTYIDKYIYTQMHKCM